MLAVPASRVASSPAPVRRIARTRRRAISTRARAAVSGTDAGLPSLTDASTWRLRFDLYSGKDPSATTPDRVVAVDVKFVVDEGYEPPQGVLQIVDDPEGILVADGRHRWTLEEVRGSNPGDDDRDPASVCAFRLDDSVGVPADCVPSSLSPPTIRDRTRTSARLDSGSGVYSRSRCIRICC